MAVPPAAVRVPSHWTLVPSLSESRLSANYKDDNEVKPRGVHRSRDIYLMVAENLENLRRPSDDGCATTHRLKWGP